MNTKISIFSSKKLAITKINETILIESQDFIKIESLNTTEAIQFSNIIFTSKNAVENAFKNYDLTNKDFSYFCVGEKTAKTLFNKGMYVEVIEKNAMNLGENLIKKNSTTGYTFFCGNMHLKDLPQLFESKEIPLQKIIVYKTIYESIKIKNEYDGYVFFSPSGLNSFLIKNKLPEKAQTFAIGSTTASEIKKRTPNQVIIAKEPKIDSVINSIKEYYSIC